MRQIINTKEHEGHRVIKAGQLFICNTCKVSGHTGEVSNRKPFNMDSGYIASLRSGKDKGWVVIYDAEKQCIDNTSGKYAVVCQTHNQIVNCKNLPLARLSMKVPDFCSECRGSK